VTIAVPAASNIVPAVFPGCRCRFGSTSASHGMALRSGRRKNKTNRLFLIYGKKDEIASPGTKKRQKKASGRRRISEPVPPEWNESQKEAVPVPARGINGAGPAVGRDPGRLLHFGGRKLQERLLG